MAVITKVNYTKAVNSTTRGWIDYLAWEMITPGYTAIFMLLTGAWYLYKAIVTEHPEVKYALYETAIAFGLWGVFNGLCYMYLAYRHSK